ncbi:MAG: PLP-dependent aspartate aminotransferase family protein [Prolixibacteraceae bacterium]|jgi:cystathionine gamma-lyase|nr:PLP-dependent aspartate aminotransferase family protein [Prolixibacteraceae bacterium]
MSHKDFSFDTRAIHVGEGAEFLEGSKNEVVAPIYLSSTYARKEVKNPGFFQYSRSQNPTRFALEQRYASLEETTYGLGFASGLAAEAAILFALLKPGDHVIGFDDLYGGTKRLFHQWEENYGVTVSLVDAAVPKNVEDAILPQTKLIWLESPSNPLLKVCDIKAIGEIAHRHQLLMIVDNTFLSPYFQKPAALGADIVVHSITKYIAGHSDVIGGAIMLNDKVLYEKIKFCQNSLGVVPSPFDCYLVLRGLKTLSLRMERHQSNALAIATYLENHPKVARVYYPGLKSHPQYEIGLRQASGFGGMISFEIAGGEKEAVLFLESLKLFTLAESLGGVESLIEHPALMTHSSITAKERELAGIKDSLIRVSIGVEDQKDLIADLEQAFGKI